MISKVLPAARTAIYSVFGWAEISQAEFNDGNTAIKNFTRELDKALTGDWLVGN
jgi:hypothetical protein